MQCDFEHYFCGIQEELAAPFAKIASFSLPPSFPLRMEFAASVSVRVRESKRAKSSAMLIVRMLVALIESMLLLLPSLVRLGALRKAVGGAKVMSRSLYYSFMGSIVLSRCLASLLFCLVSVLDEGRRKDILCRRGEERRGEERAQEGTEQS